MLHPKPVIPKHNYSRVMSRSYFIMNRQIPIVNRVVHRKEQERVNDLHFNRIMSMKFSNISSLKGKSEAQSAQKVKQVENCKLTPIDGRNKRVKTVMNDDRIRQENKSLYSRLVNQKPTLSSKSFAEQRHRNLQFLKRIGRYPYKPNSTMLEPLKEQELNNHIERSNTYANAEELESAMSNLKISLNSVESMKQLNINNKIEEEDKKQYTILLWSKVIQLQKNWHTVKFLRFKNHYQIEVSPYPDCDFQYYIKLNEEIGTLMLSENDYDYEYISIHFIKFTHQALCLSFELSSEKKKHFYKFQKRKAKNEGNSPPRDEESNFNNKAPAYRKTVFALENEQNELKLQNNLRARVRTQSVEADNYESALHDMSKEDIVIDLSKRGES